MRKREIRVLVDSHQDFEGVLKKINAQLFEHEQQWQRNLDGLKPETDSNIIANINEEFGNAKSNLNLVFDMPKLQFSQETHDYIINLLKFLNSSSQNVAPTMKLADENLMINSNLACKMNADDLKFMLNLRSEIVDGRLAEDLKARELFADNDCQLKSILKANEIVQKTADEIKRRNLSPFEAVLFAHRFCSQFYYTSEAENFSPKNLESFAESGNIVCVGFSSLFKAILDKCALDGLEVKFNQLVSRKTQDGGHANNLVSIEDPKYGISGNYVVDTTWNSIASSQNFPNNFSFCMSPIADVENTMPRYYYSTEASVGEFFDANLDNVFRNMKLDPRPRAKALKTHNQFIEQTSEPIPLECFEKGLFSLAISDGKTDVEAADYANAAIFDSMQGALDIFNKNASNCFVAAAKQAHLKKPAPTQPLTEPSFADFCNENGLDLESYQMAMAEFKKAQAEQEKAQQEAAAERETRPQKNLDILSKL